MRSYRTFIFGGLLFIGLLIMGAPGDSFAQSPEQTQWQKLEAITQMQDARDRGAALNLFMKEYPDTPFKANVYRLQFLSLREFVQDDDQLWELGVRYLDAFAKLVDTDSDPYEKNPLLAHIYNEVAYEFAERGKHLDGALLYAGQSLSYIEKAAAMRSPDVPEEQWKIGVTAYRGQILDTIGWIQFKRNALNDAEKAIADAIALIPDNGTLHYHLGQIRVAQGQTDAAIEAFLTAATVEVPVPDAQEALKRLYRKKYGDSAEAKLAAIFEDTRARAQTKKMQEIVSNKLNIPALDFNVTTLNGDAVSLSSLKGKVVVVNFWATWCPPCQEEMPILQKVWESFQGKEVEFLIASVDEEKDKVQPYIDKRHYTFPVYYGGAAAQTYGVISIPTTVVIDKSGKIQYKQIGYRPDIMDVLSWEINALTSEK